MKPWRTSVNSKLRTQNSKLKTDNVPPFPVIGIAPAPDLDAALCSSASSGWPPGQSLLASVAHRDPRPTGGAIAESSLHSDSAGRCWTCCSPKVGVAPAALTARRAFGRLLRPAIRRNLAPAGGHHLTPPRGPRDEALRAPRPPTKASGKGTKIRNSHFEILNTVRLRLRLRLRVRARINARRRR